MRHPLAAWRAGARWPLVSLGLIAALLIAIGACEAAGWPFLVTPMQRWLTTTLDRRVVFDVDTSASGAVRIGLLGSIRIEAPSLEIGAPAWSSSPHMLLAHGVRLKLGYYDLWLAWRGDPLHVADLEAADLDAALERRGDGRTSWQFSRKAEPDSSDKPTAFPTFGQLRVGAGHLSYDDEILPAAIDSRFALSDGSGVAAEASAASSAASPSDNGIVIRAGGTSASASAVAGDISLAPGTSGLILKAVGRYRQLPLRVDLRTDGILGLFLAGKQAEAQPLKLLASVGGADLSFEGSTSDPLHFAGLKGRFTLSGPSLAVVGDLLGITLPTTPPFKTAGTLAKDGKVWNAVFDAAAIGSSRLTGAFVYDQRPKVPLLSGRVGGARLVLADLGPAVGTPVGSAASAQGDRVIPDKHFDLPSLRAMDANVLAEVAMFDPGTPLIEPLRPVRAHILLADGVLTIADFVGSTADGRMVGFLQLDGRGGQALWTADMRALGIDLSQWLRLKRKGDAPPYLSGKLDALVKVKGQGRSTAEILGSLEGDIRAHVRDGAVSHVAIEVAGVDVAQALGVYIKGDDALPILCNVADLDIVKGVAQPKVFIVNTKDSTVWIDGSVSLKTEALDLRAIVSPKDFSPLTLRTPIHVRGVLGKPAVSLEKGTLAAKAGAAALLALLNPVAAIIPFVDPGARDAAKSAAAQCAALAPTSASIPRAALAPGNLHVPPAALPSPSPPGASAPH
jgi:AsmA family protein